MKFVLVRLIQPNETFLSKLSSYLCVHGKLSREVSTELSHYIIKLFVVVRV